jgi:hypothetical protein
MARMALRVRSVLRARLLVGFILGDGAAQESNLPSLGLPDLTGFEDRSGHRALPLRGRS